MMIKPQLVELMNHVDCRYTLVAVVSKRARQIVEDAEGLDWDDVKPVALAVDDLMHDRIIYKKPDIAPNQIAT